jgi:hypothetical protein
MIELILLFFVVLSIVCINFAVKRKAVIPTAKNSVPNIITSSHSNEKDIKLSDPQDKTAASPSPIKISIPANNLPSKYNFKWDPSYDLGGNKLTYRFEVSTKADFSEEYFSKEGLTDTKFSMEKPPKGKYFWRVTVVSSKGKEQIAFDKYVDDVDNSKVYFGVKTFTVE